MGLLVAAALVVCLRTQQPAAVTSCGAMLGGAAVALTWEAVALHGCSPLLQGSSGKTPCGLEVADTTRLLLGGGCGHPLVVALLEVVDSCITVVVDLEALPLAGTQQQIAQLLLSHRCYACHTISHPAKRRGKRLCPRA